MAEYIDREKLKRDLIDNRSFYPAIVKNAIENAPTEDVVPKSEYQELEYKLIGVMHFVDKWLEGDELNQDEVNRAMTMREKTLKLVENLEYKADFLEQSYNALEKEVEQLQKQIEPFKEIGCFTCKWYLVMRNHAPCYKCKEFSQYIWLSADVETSENSIKSEIEQAKQEVAKQIFEEIEELGNTDYQTPLGTWVTMQLEKYAELKKKYIGETRNASNTNK